MHLGPLNTENMVKNLFFRLYLPTICQIESHQLCQCVQIVARQMRQWIQNTLVGAIDASDGPQSGHIDAFDSPQSGHIDTVGGTQSGHIDVFSAACSTRIST